MIIKLIVCHNSLFTAIAEMVYYFYRYVWVNVYLKHTKHLKALRICNCSLYVWTYIMISAFIACKCIATIRLSLFHPPLPLPPSSGSLAPCRRPHLSGAAVRHWWLRLLELICLWSALSSRVWLSATLTTGSHTPVPAALHPLLRWDLSVLLAPAVFGSDQNTNHLFKL